MLEWLQFGIPSGQALFVAGSLDLIIAVSKIFETYAAYYYEGTLRLPLTEFSHHLDYMEYIQLSLETSKLLLTLAFWFGGLLYGHKSILKAWIYISISLEVVLQLLIWIVKYHLLLTDIEIEAIPMLKLSYSGLIRLLVRLYLIGSVFCFLRRSSNPNLPTTQTTTQGTGTADANAGNGLSSPPHTSSLVQVIEDVDLLPVGTGFIKIIHFYHLDINRLARFLLTVDFSWGLCRILENEISQAFFGQQIKALPSSSVSTPIWTEERIIRIFRIIFDLIFLQNMKQGNPPLQGGMIIPKIVEILVSLGILIFLRIAEYQSFPLILFTIYYIFYILDILFRIITFGICYKAYGDHLCQSQRTAIANAKLRAQNLINNK